MKPLTIRGAAWSVPAALVLSVLLAGQSMAASWSTPVVLGANGSFLGGSPVFAATGADTGVVAYVERDTAVGFSRVYVRGTNDGGITWSVAQLVSGPNEAGYPAIAAVDQRVYLTWLESGIRFRKSADGGVTWKLTRKLGAFRQMIWPSIAAAPGGKVAVSWAEWDTDRIRVRISDNRGRTFSPADTIGTTTMTAESKTAAAYGDGVLYVAYWGSANRLKLRRTTNDGLSWKATQRLATDGHASQQVSIAAVGAQAVVAFGGFDVRFRTTTDKGLSWSPTTVLGINSNNGGIAATFAEGTFHLAYATGSPGVQWQTAHYRTSADGLTWAVPSTVVSAATASPTGVGALAGDPLVFYEGAAFRAEVRRGS